MNTASAHQAKVILLGAGEPYLGASPTALRENIDRRRVLDWTFDAFRNVDVEWWFVGGYKFDAIRDAYPALMYAFNPEWQQTGPAGSLLAAPIDDTRDHFVCYTDVVFRASLVQSMMATEGDVVLAVDSAWRARYEDRSSEDLAAAEIVKTDSGESAEFVGVALFREKPLQLLDGLRDGTGADGVRKLRLSELTGHEAFEGLRVSTVDVVGDWAELNAPQDLARFVLGTKGDTLQRLAPLVTCSEIGQVYLAPVSRWREEPAGIVNEIRKMFGEQRLAIRSSGAGEDKWSASNAGAYESALDVDATDDKDVSAAIDRVIASYGADASILGEEQVLIQPMVGDVTASGVAFTRTLDTGAPYYVINYDIGQETDSVTGGTSATSQVMYLTRDGDPNCADAPAFLPALVDALRELETLVGHDCIDVEFAISGESRVHVLQVRPIAVRHDTWRLSDKEFKGRLDTAAARYRELTPPAPFVLGDRAVYGVMPDWNPAEIIGTCPRRLALSLYRYLITDEIWATQRAQAGFRDVRFQPLMTAFLGHPFIDVRASFNSFIPADLPDDLAERLVNHYLARLVENPHLHDKIEFDIAFTCWSPDFDASSARLATAGFSANDIATLKRGLVGITSTAMSSYTDHLEQITELAQRTARILEKAQPGLDRGIMLIEECRRNGTLPFAHLARDGFVAVSFLRGCVAEGVLSRERVEQFMLQADSVTREIVRDGRAVADGDLAFENFAAKYGHLRPGTYDITSHCYASDPAYYLEPLVKVGVVGNISEAPPFQWSEAEVSKLRPLLKSENIDTGIDELTAFLNRAIHGREYAKFQFTRTLSLALEDIAEFGDSLGLDRAAMSHLDLEIIRMAATGASTSDLGEWLATRVEMERRDHEQNLAFKLPPLISSVEHFNAFGLPESTPNFVGRDKVMAEVKVLAKLNGSASESSPDVAGKIILIEQADPGYDWLFGQGIAGLVTLYGGANSHMAIRSAEMKLPAAIGVGERLYTRLRDADVISLDCAGQTIEVLR